MTNNRHVELDELKCLRLLILKSEKNDRCFRIGHRFYTLLSKDMVQ